jgi:nucleotide-binding universal stress UspA family protein
MKILLAVDDSQPSYEAAAVVSEWFPADSTVVALHVGSSVPTSAIAAPVEAAGFGYPAVALPLLRSERRRIYLEAREVAERAAAIARGDARAEAGDPAQKIIEVASEIDADLIVIGTGDRSWLSRVITPSVSDEVVHNAPCPVLVVRPDTPGDA